MNIILDTSFLITAVKFKVDIFEKLKEICDFPYKLYILDKTLDELKGKKQERLINQLIKDKVGIITTKEGKVDDLLVEQKDAIIATQDKLLKERLKNQKTIIITIRQKKYLRIE